MVVPNGTTAAGSFLQSLLERRDTIPMALDMTSPLTASGASSWNSGDPWSKLQGLAAAFGVKIKTVKLD